jgi:large subunit ribosomal protein L6
MSRVGKKPVSIPSGIHVSVTGSSVTVKGPKGEMARELHPLIKVSVEGDQVVVERTAETREGRSFHGLYRSLIANMIEGVDKGFSIGLEIQGVGFKADSKGSTLLLSLGFSSVVEYNIPDGVTVAIDGGTKLQVSGVDKQKVGEVAARIRAFAPAEPYKGKGVRYAGERVRRKVGKTVA